MNYTEVYMCKSGIKKPADIPLCYKQVRCGELGSYVSCRLTLLMPVVLLHIHQLMLEGPEQHYGNMLCEEIVEMLLAPYLLLLE